MTTDRVREKELVDNVLRAWGELGAEVRPAAEAAAIQTDFTRADHREAWAAATEAHVTCQTETVLAAVALKEFWESNDPAPGLVHDHPAAAALIRATGPLDVAAVRSRMAEMRAEALGITERFRGAAGQTEADQVFAEMKHSMTTLGSECADVVEAVRALFDYNEDRGRQAMLDGFIQAARMHGIGAQVTETIVMPDGERVVLRDERVAGDEE